MSHRRRGADFSHLLESFCNNTTDCRSDLEAASRRISPARSNIANDATYDGNRRMNSKSPSEDETSGTCSYKSLILAGHVAESESQGSTENSYQTAQSGSIAGGSRSGSTNSWRLEAPSLMNRAMDLRFEPQPDLDLTQSTAEPRFSGELNKNINQFDKSFDDCRDNNFNIRNASEGASKFEAETYKGINSPRRESRRRSMTERDRWNVLSRLDNVLDPFGDKTVKTKEKILRRLSQEFAQKPRTFTERLVTIIDESETSYAIAANEPSGVELNRMTKEFRNMCKYIQDESMPEWAPSLCANSTLGTSRYPEDDILAKIQRPETIEESPSVSSSTDCKTPQHDEIAAKKIYRKTPLNIFKNTFRENRAVGSPDSPGSPNSTRDFEKLERYVEALPHSPKSPSRKLRRSVSTSDISEPSREKLTIKCQELLRSLDDTNTLGFDTFDSHRGRRVQEQRDIEQRDIDQRSSNTRDDNCSAKTDNSVKKPIVNYGEVDEGDLSTSLLIEWRKKRQRCFDTAMKMQEIEKDTKNTNEEYPKALYRHGIDPGTEFMKTITTCFAYQNCVAGLLQKENSKRMEGSSADSGIDTRSISRTLRTSSKKLSNTESPVKISNKFVISSSTTKNQRSEGLLSSRWNSTRLGTGALKKADRKLGTASNLQQRTTRNINKTVLNEGPRKKSPTFLCPGRISLGRSRSRSREKRSPARQVVSMIRNLRTSEPKRVNENRAKTPVPEINLEQPSPEMITISDSNSPIFSEEKRSGRSKSNTPKSIARRARTPERNYVVSSTMASPLMRNRSKERVAKMTTCETEKRAESSPVSSKKANSPRRKFFVTPGKTVPVNKKKRTFFPNIEDNINEDLSRRVMKSLHAPGIYRLGYQTVISPVSMYIHGTDMNLIQNKHEKKNEMLLTPSKATASEEKLEFKLSGKTSTPRDSPRKHRLFVNKEDFDLQFETDENDENVQELDFALPKATYKLPAQVHMVNESPTYKRGARTRGLLQSMQNRLVIRHESKRLGKRDDNEVPESGSDSVDMSIHVQKSAEKTNYMSHWK